MAEISDVTPEPEFNPEDLKDLENDLGETPIEDDDDEVNIDDDDIEAMFGDAHGCNCPECQDENEEGYVRFPRFLAKIPVGKAASLTPEELASIARCVPAASEELGDIGDGASMLDIESLVYSGLRNLNKCLGKTISLRETVEALGGSTTRDMGMLMASITEEIARLGSTLSKLSAMSRKT